jgi:hypothetical protein
MSLAQTNKQKPLTLKIFDLCLIKKQFKLDTLESKTILTEFVKNDNYSSLGFAESLVIEIAARSLRVKFLNAKVCRI